MTSSDLYGYTWILYYGHTGVDDNVRAGSLVSKTHITGTLKMDRTDRLRTIRDISKRSVTPI